MEIVKGRQQQPIKLVLYGTEGIGKSTFMSKLPDPLYIDTEGSTANMDIKRFDPAPSDWPTLLAQVQYVIDHPDCCKTLVIDTADWAETLCGQYVCSKNNVQNLEAFGYGKGQVYLGDEYMRLLRGLDVVRQKGIHVAIAAHAIMRKFEQPDEAGAYDRWELKLARRVAPMVKEWSDILLFANYKTTVVNVDNKGAAKGKNKAMGGSRVMYASHHPCWDAKNRFNLPDEMPFDFSQIAHLFTPEQPTPSASAAQTTVTASVSNAAPTAAASAAPDVPPAVATPADKLRELMRDNEIAEDEICFIVAKRGYYPMETGIENYDPGFIENVLIAAWDQVKKMIEEERPNMNLPF